MKVHGHNLEVSQRYVKKHLSHALEISCCNPGMDIYENRRQWLAYWIEHDFGGDRAAAERTTEYSRSQLSQFLSRKYQDGKSIQERAARTIETRFGKPERIMETPAPTADRPPLVPTLRYEGEPAPVKTDEQQLPDFVRKAIEAVKVAHSKGAPREIFDGITALLSTLNVHDSGTITSQQDETVSKAASPLASMSETAEQEIRDAESRLATRDEDHRAARRSGERRSKGIRH
ncbi:hypothetical protein G4D42_06300 [Burkholderia pseudomallei]|uniref:hypothetical protein n=1 Tax=Burkholderia pseudomallei TaxID=28450 RepID=UPI001593F258|nr:hypothetical protein [Burkholderia pseudomallei]NVI23067.1 hypothetical protein [Burkholderia pseudomallei]